jgi:hypothetical protein
MRKAFVAFFLLFFAPSDVGSQGSFYQGKTVVFAAGYIAGSYMIFGPV